MPYTIYKITNPENKIYIGRTVNYEKRLKALRYYTSLYKNKLELSLREFGFNNHQFEIIEVVSDVKTSRGRCQFWINYFKSKFFEIINEKGLNYDIGGAGSAECTPERKLAISKANKGKKRSDEYKDFCREKGLKLRKFVPTSEEEKKIIKDYLNNDILLSDIKNKYKLSQRQITEIISNKKKVKKTHRGRYVINFKTKKIFKSIKDAAEANNLAEKTLERYLKLKPNKCLEIKLIFLEEYNRITKDGTIDFNIESQLNKIIKIKKKKIDMSARPLISNLALDIKYLQNLFIKNKKDFNKKINNILENYNETLERTVN